MRNYWHATGTAPGAELVADALSACYRDWCEGNGEKHLSTTAFGNELRCHGIRKEKSGTVRNLDVRVRHGR